MLMSNTILSGLIELTDAELDAVNGGALVNVVAVDVVDISNVANDLTVNLPVAAAVAVLGAAAAGNAFEGSPGRNR
jgi:hypothetical protein